MKFVAVFEKSERCVTVVGVPFFGLEGVFDCKWCVLSVSGGGRCCYIVGGG